MNYNSFSILVFIIALLSIGCSDQKNKKLSDGKLPTVEINGMKIADLDPYLLAPVDVKLSQLAENIRIIPLETNPESLLSGSVDFQIGEKYILARNRTGEGVFQFTIDGSFIRKLSLLAPLRMNSRVCPYYVLLKRKICCWQLHSDRIIYIYIVCRQVLS